MINVHIIASKSNILNNVDAIRSIMDTVRKNGHDIVDNWVDEVYEERVAKGGAPVDWAKIYASNLENIAKADIVIAETSYNSFGVGYQVAVAVQQKKPTLLLRHEDAETDAFATGVVDSWVQRASYSNKTLPTILEKFLSDNDINTKDMRFNFFIDRAIYNYLRWAALKTGKTKAEVLRELVQREIENKEV